MLCRVEFLEAPRAASVVASAMGVAVYVPATALRDGTAWICDVDSLRAERRDVVSSEVSEGLIRVDSGIRPGEWVIADPSDLREGQRLKPRVTEQP